MAFGNESSAAKSARVKLQLRDKKGRWIEMGGGVKWYSANLGKYMFGKVTDAAGPGLAVVEVDTGNKEKPLTVNIPSSQLEKVKAKATLDPSAHEKIDPAISVESKSEVKPPKEKSNSLFEELHKNSVHSKEPFGPGYEKVPFDPKGTNNLEKNDLVTFVESGVLKKGHVIGFQDGKPIIQPEVSSNWGFGGKGTIQPLVNIDGLYKPVGSNPSNAGSPDTEAKSSIVPSPDGKTPALVIPKEETRQSINDVSAQDMAKMPVGTKLVSSKGDMASFVKEDGDVWAHYISNGTASGTKSTSASIKNTDTFKDHVFDTPESDIPAAKPKENTDTVAPAKDAFGKDTASSGNVKATSNEQNSPGSFYVESADGSPLVTSVADLKPGDKVYPVGTEQKPYGTHGNYNPKGTHVNLNHAAGLGTVTKKGPNYASVEGEDGKTYYPTNKFVAMKVTPDTEKALGQIASKAKTTISQDEAKAIQDNKDNITQVADNLLENGIPATNKKSISLEQLVDAAEGSAVLDGPGLSDPSSTIIFKKKPDGGWISLGGNTKTSDELAAQLEDAKLLTPEGYSKYQVSSFMNKQEPGEGISDDQNMFVKNVNGTWHNVKDENTELATEQVSVKLNTENTVKAHTAEEVNETKQALAPVPEEPAKSIAPDDLPAPTAETLVEQFGKVYSDDQGDYMVGKNGAKFRKGEKVLTSNGKGEEAEVLALYEGVESARVLLPNGKKSIKKINTLVHANKSSEDNTATPEADVVPQTPEAPEVSDTQTPEANVPGENPDEIGHNDSMPTNPAPVDEEVDTVDPEEPVATDSDLQELEQAAGPIDVSAWKKIKSSSGSNPGGEYEAPDGTHFFVKQSKSDRHAKNEILASDFYQAAGVHHLELGYANVDGKGKLGTIAPMLDGSQDNFESKLSDPEYKKAFQEGWAVDAWLGNWDVVGLNFDNALTDKDGKAIRVDPGGAMLFRAMGSPKTDSMFTDEVGEWDSMRTDPNNYQTHKVFGDMTDQQIVDSVNKVALFDDAKIDALVDKNNFDEADAIKLKQKLKARRDDLINKAAGLNLEPTKTSDSNESSSDISAPDIEVTQPAQTEDTENGLAQWEKDLLNSAIDSANEPSVSELQPPATEDYSKPGTTYTSPYNGEATVTGKNSKPVYKGVDVSYTKKGETKEGKVVNILVNQQSASVKWPDGTTSIIKGSQLNSKEGEKATPTPTPSTPEPVSVESVPEPAIIPNTDDINGWNDSQPSAADLPIGSYLETITGTNKYTKTGPDEWTSVQGGQYTNENIDVVKGLKSAGKSAYKLTVADVVVEPETNSTKMPWSSQAPSAKDLPIGSKISTNKTGKLVTYEKTGANAWDNTNSGSTGYSNNVIDSVKNENSYELEIPSGVDIPKANSVETHPNEMPWNESHDLVAADLPIGTTMGDEPNSGYKKTGENEWTSNNGTGAFKYSDNTMDNSKSKGTEGGYYKIYLPAGTKVPKHLVPEEPKVAENVWNKNDKPAKDFPIGTKLKFGNTVIEKTDKNSWKSNTTAITYHDSDVQNLPVNIWTFEVPENATAMDNNAVTKPFDSSIPDVKDLPTGSMIKSPTGLISFTKNANGKWIDNYGDPLVGNDSTLDGTKDSGWTVTYNPAKVVSPAPTSNITEPDTNTGTGNTAADIENVVEATSTSVEDYFDTYQETASWDMFVTMFDEGEIDIENVIFVHGQKYYVTPTISAGPDYAFMLLDDQQTSVSSFIANKPYGSFDTNIFRDNLIKAVKDLPKPPASDIPPAPIYEDPVPDDFSIATVNLAFNDYLSQIKSMSWTEIKNISEPAMFASNDGKKEFFLQAHPMSTPYFTKFQIIDENGNDVPTDNDLMWDANYGEAKFTGQEILDAIEKHIGKVDSTPSDTFDIAEGTKLSEIDYKDFAALPAGTKINYLVNGSIFGTYLKNSNNSWRFQQATKEKPSHKSDSNADFKFIMDNNPDMASNYQIIAPDAPESDVTDIAPIATPIEKFEFTAVQLDEQILDGYPVGTVAKTEASAYYNQNNTHMYKKISDDTWEEYKKTANTLSKTKEISSNTFAAMFKWNGTKFAVSTPKSDDHVMLGNGQLGYVGNHVFTSGSSKNLTIEKINKSYINVKDEDGNKLKIPAKKLFIDSSYGVKAPTSYSSGSTSKYDLHTNNPLETYLEATKAEKAAEEALKNFAGASATEYDMQGLGLKYSKNALENKKSGLSVIDVTAVDTTHELYGKPQPQPPTALEDYPSFEESVLNDLPKWDSAAWLKGVEDRYKANPNKKFDTVQQSTQWLKVQAVLDGKPGWGNYLDQLKGSKYVDEDLYNMASIAIKKQEETNKPLQKAHNENIAKEKAEYEANKAVYMAEYADKMSEYTKKLAEWSTVNTNVGNIKKLPVLPAPSSTPFTGGPADWSKAHPGTHSVQSIMDTMRTDNLVGRFGLSAAVGSEKIEANLVNFQKVLDTNGKEKFEVHFKLTHAFGNLMDSKLKMDPSVNKSHGIYYNNKTNMLGKPDDALAKLAGKPTDSKFVNDGNRYEFTDAVTGVPVVFQHSTQQGQNVSINNNSVQILLDINATPADLQLVLENLGVDAKPATAGALRVTAENKLITLFSGKSNLGIENLNGDQRAKALENIKKDFDITVDDVVVETDPNGHTTFFLSDAKAEKLASEFSVKYFQHSIYAGEDPEVWESILTGTNPGLLSNYHRGNYGIGVLKSNTGMSPDKDMAVGSGDHLFVSPVSKPTQTPYSSYIGIKTKSILRRLDIWANMGDDYGRRDKSNKAAFPLMKDHAHFNETIVRDSIPLADFEWVNIGSAAGKKELIKRLNAKGIYMINGVPLEKFILSVGETVPNLPDVNIPGLDLVDINADAIVPSADIAPAAPAAGPAV
jgi:hypothetical protein